MNRILASMVWTSAIVILLLTAVLPKAASAQDQDDPPNRVARLGYMEGSVSFQPAGESDWVQAVPNRPMTTGDRLWADQGSRAEVEVGSAVIRLAANTGFSFLNLDDRTLQIELTSGSLNLTVRRLGRGDIFEVDTPNQAFSAFEPGHYRLEASEDGTYTVVTVREGNGESTGNGQTYSLHAGQTGTFSGTDVLNADVEQIGEPDQFDNWAYTRDRRHEGSRSAQYLSRDVVGYDDLDDNGEWRDDSNYGHVWFPSQVSSDWAPYRDGHWDWISPWGWTWVDDAAWGYAPFHYGRWVTVDHRWGWVAGPANVAPVYAPALVVFLGTSNNAERQNVGWFPLGPREVYVPSYNVSREYVNRVNLSNTIVNTTTITNVYNTTIVNKTFNITNVTYMNKNVAGAVTAVPQRAFVSAQPVARAAVAVNARDMASLPVSSRAAVAPSRESVLGMRANTAGHVTAPPAAVARRQVVAKTPPPPAPVAFTAQQQALSVHPGQPLARHEVQTLRPTNAPATQPLVKQAPPGKPATPNMVRPASQPGNSRNVRQPGPPANTTPGNQPTNRPNQPTSNERPGADPNRPAPNQPGPNNRPDTNRPPTEQPNNRTEPNRPQPQPGPNTRPEANRPPSEPPNNGAEPNRPQPQPGPNTRPGTNRPPSEPPNNRVEPNRPQPQPGPNSRPETNRPPSEPPNNRTEPNRPQPQPGPNARPEVNRPPSEPPNNRTEPNRPQPQPGPNSRPEANRPPSERWQPPEEKRRQDEQRQDEKAQPPQ